MQRTCDGTDENLIGSDGKPCTCGMTFDDVDHYVIYPHAYIPSREERDAMVEKLLVEHGIKV